MLHDFYIRLMRWMNDAFGYRATVWIEDSIVLFSGIFLGIVVCLFVLSYFITRSVRDPELHKIALVKGRDERGRTTFYSNPTSISEIVDVLVAIIRSTFSRESTVMIHDAKRERWILWTVIGLAALFMLVGLWMMINIYTA